MMDAYKAWVRQNRQWVSSFESLASTATWFLPERFTESELTPEAVSTVLGLVTVMNQHIVETAPPSRGTGAGLHHAAESEPKVDSTPWSLCISVMKEVEVLIEMVAEHYLGKDRKWGPVASVEAIKALIRVIILKENGYRMLLDGGESKNVGDSATKDSSRGPPSGSPEQNLGRPVQNFPTLPRREGSNVDFYPRDLEGRAMQAMHKFTNNSAGPSRPSWLRRQQEPQEESRSPQGPLSYNLGTPSLERNVESHPSRTFIGGEVLLISRPLLYVLLVWRYGLKSWRPWLAALSIDLAGMYLVSSSTSLPQRRLGLTDVVNTQQGSRIPLSSHEALELRRRQLRWAFYVLRNPFFDRFTRRPVEAAERILSPIPLVGMLAGQSFLNGPLIIIWAYYLSGSCPETESHLKALFDQCETALHINLKHCVSACSLTNLVSEV